MHRPAAPSFPDLLAEAGRQLERVRELRARERARIRLILAELADIIDTLEGGAAPMAAPKDHFKSLVTGLRADIQDAVKSAKFLRERSAKSIPAFRAAAAELHSVIIEVDAATAEINGALLGDDGDNGGPKIKDEVKNSDAGSQASDGSSATVDTRAASFSALHPSQRRPPGQ